MSFQNLYRRIRGATSVSHAWITLHRLVEAYCHSVAQPFPEVFAELEARHGFSRTDPARWPALPAIQAAARSLAERRAAVLAEQAAWIAIRRREKAEAPGSRAPAALREANARSRAYAATLPRVGYWGWRKRRVRAPR